jgi:hypothetical protein
MEKIPVKVALSLRGGGGVMYISEIATDGSLIFSSNMADAMVMTESLARTIGTKMQHDSIWGVLAETVTLIP